MIAHRREVLQGLLATGAGSLLSAAPVWAAQLTPEGAYTLAREAYRYAFPLIYFGRMRHRLLVTGDDITGKRQPLGGWSHSNQVVTPAVPGAPQTDTLYSRVWADLTEAPLLLRIPKMDGRYWSIQCCDFFGVTYAMINRRNTKDAALIALVGPNWKGTLPKEVAAVYRAQMPWTFQLMRMYFASETDRANAISLQQDFTTFPLSAYGKEAAWTAPLAEVFAPAERAKDPLADLKLLQHMWRECPPPKADVALTSRFAAIWLSKTGRLEDLPADIQAALARAEADGLKEIVATTRNMPGDVSANGWSLPRREIGLYRDRDYLYRAAIAQLGTIGTPIDENIYMLLQRDGTGAMLTGDGRYELRYEADNMPEAHAFWSLHAYRYTYTVIPNSSNRYSISNRTPGLHYAPDGSLTVYLQAQDPGGDKSANWIPIDLPGQPFFLITRAYEPFGRMLDLKWPGPKLTRVA